MKKKKISEIGYIWYPLLHRVLDTLYKKKIQINEEGFFGILKKESVNK